MIEIVDAVRYYDCSLTLQASVAATIAMSIALCTLARLLHPCSTFKVCGPFTSYLALPGPSTPLSTTIRTRRTSRLA